MNKLLRVCVLALHVIGLLFVGLAAGCLIQMVVCPLMSAQAVVWFVLALVFIVMATACYTSAEWVGNFASKVMLDRRHIE